jgi:alkylation response protein AidB-like acyl-CoA dehydrogenase
MTDFSADDRNAISEMFGRLLTDEASEEVLRKTMATEAGYDPALWAKMAELGLTGLMIDPGHGGIGGSAQEAEALMEVAGAHLYSSPFLQSCIIAPVLLQASTNTETTAPLLESIASGELIATVAGCGPSGDWTQAPSITASTSSGNWTLEGAANFVVHARNANIAIVRAQADIKTAMFVVDMADVSIKTTPHGADDRTLRLSTVTFDKTPAQHLVGVESEEIERALLTALVALAGEQAGATRRIFDLTIDYLNTRYQFGQPIGRFQALKHMAADLLVEVESSVTVARHAARAVASGADNAASLTYLAAFTCADNFRTVSADAIQLFGGIAYTMEHPAHLYWRRAQTGQWLFGSSDRFRDLYLTEMEAML